MQREHPFRKKGEELIRKFCMTCKREFTVLKKFPHCPNCGRKLF